MELLNNLLSSDGYTPVNKKLAKILGFTHAGFIGELIRQRKRFGKEEFYFTQKEMEEEIGLSPKQQRLIISDLIKKQIISITSKGLPKQNYYIINDEILINVIKEGNKISTSSDETQLLQKGTTGSAQREQLVVPKGNNYTLLENKNTNNNTNKELSDFEKTFEEFKLHRREIKSKMTKRAEDMILKKLNELADNEEDKILILEQSIENGWKGIFELKNKKINWDKLSDKECFSIIKQDERKDEELKKINYTRWYTLWTLHG